ncbi:MAG TPA: tetratricopeptide repeat protein [Chthoniobacteraceae bacterium]|jgi:TolA-binding protein|nr:tetratricopeptide repeat protein [Chthoniobacteraceae bacterium]
MKLLTLCLLAPAAALACGGYFYEAPPTLERYPERLPVKTLRDLVREMHPPAAAPATVEQLDHAVRNLAAMATIKPHEPALAMVEKLQEKNRTGEYRKRFANCLNDLHDLLTDGGADEAGAGEYITARTTAMDADNGFILRPEVKESDLRTARQREAAGLKQRDAVADNLQQEADKAGPALRPHWLVLLGAHRFRHGQFDEAERVFWMVVNESPESPRAEIAMLMLGRCKLEQWRDVKTFKASTEQERNELENAADQAFTDYLEKYPQGRFALDVPGWRVDLARESDEPSRAYSLLLEQLDVTGHPEIVRRAAREMELLLDDTDFDEEEDEAGPTMFKSLPIDDLAKRPLAALAVVYHFLDPRSREDFATIVSNFEYHTERVVVEQDLQPVLSMRRAGRVFLPKLAEALGKRRAEISEEWRPRYLAVLAWAASEAGEQRQAVRLCELAGPRLETSDDLSFARAVALQRAGDFPAARAAFTELRARFPQSPLRREFAFRLATILRDQGEAGLAVAELLRMRAEEQAELEADQAATLERVRKIEEDDYQDLPLEDELPSLHLPAELDQWVDTMLQFAPLDQLQRGADAVAGDAEQSGRFKAILRYRYLAAEQLAAALQYPPVEDNFSRTFDHEKGEAKGPLAGDEWRAAVRHLEKLTRGRAKGPPAQQARAEYALAEAWAHVRGRLTIPSEEFDPLFLSGLSPAADERVRNARAAGYSTVTAARELESRDELRHALPHYVAAADLAAGTELAGRALRKANDALRLLAERTTWTAARAFETDAEALSRQWYERLEKEAPGPPGTNVWWSFRPPAEKPWTRYSLQTIAQEGEVAILQSFIAPDGPEEDGEVAWAEVPREWSERLVKLSDNAAKWEPGRLIEELEKIRADFRIRNANGAALLNDLDDLTLFLREPGVTPEERAAYFGFRLLRNNPEGTHPEALKRWDDYVTFLNLVRETGPIDPETDRMKVRPMTVRMREFLEKFPKSRKREAAMARLAIASVREAHGHAGVADLENDEPPQLSGGQTVKLARAHPERLAEARAAVDAYQREFPEGRYAVTVRLWRGALAIDEKDWPRALGDLTATLDAPEQDDLYLDASLNLGCLFLQLLDQPNQRVALLAALRRQPAAQRRLWQFMAGETPGARLRALEGFLRDQLAGG